MSQRRSLTSVGNHKYGRLREICTSRAYQHGGAMSDHGFHGYSSYLQTPTSHDISNRRKNYSGKLFVLEAGRIWGKCCYVRISSTYRHFLLAKLPQNLPSHPLLAFQSPAFLSFTNYIATAAI